MFPSLSLALLSWLANPHSVQPPNATRPGIAYTRYPATVQQPFELMVQSHAATERLHAQLWARRPGEKKWVCVNYDLSHPVRREMLVEECGFLLPQGRSHTLRYTLSELDVYLLRDLRCVVDHRAEMKIKIESCTTWGLDYGDSKPTLVAGF